MLLTDSVMRTEQPGLQIGEGDVNHRQMGVGLFTVAIEYQGLVRVPQLCQPIVAVPSIGAHHCSFHHVFLHEPGERRGADGKKRKKALYAGRLRLRLAPNRGATTLTAFVKDDVMKGGVVRTDGWDGYDGLAKLGYAHEPLVLDGDGEKTDAHLPMIHIAFSNLKTWLLGTHHGVSQQHLQAYLNEFVFRFNRRFYPMTAFNSILGIAAHASAPTYETLYSGEWTHPIA